MLLKTRVTPAVAGSFSLAGPVSDLGRKIINRARAIRKMLKMPSKLFRAMWVVAITPNMEPGMVAPANNRPEL